MSVVSRAVFSWFFIALSGIFPEAEAVIFRQVLPKDRNAIATESSTHHGQLDGFSSESKPILYDSISDKVIHLDYRPTTSVEVSGEATTKEEDNDIYHLPSLTKQYKSYRDGNSRTGYVVRENGVRRLIRKRQSRSVPRILVRVKRRETRRPDFTQINRDVCPPSLCRALDERSRGAPARPRGTAGSVFYQGDIVLDPELERIIYANTNQSDPSTNSSRSKRSSDTGDTRKTEISRIEGRRIQNEAGKREDSPSEAVKEQEQREQSEQGLTGVWRTEERSGRRRRATMKRRDRLWKNGIVPFRIIGQIRATAKRAIQRGIKHIQDKTCIRFREKKDGDSDFVRFISEPGCWSQVGRVGGRQQVSLGRGCESLGTAVHEILHALGVWHEQARPDRDRYVQILKDNISKRFWPEFEAVSRRLVTDRGYPYDYESVVHYGKNAFTRNGEPTIKIIGVGERLNLRIGQDRGLSTIDTAQLRDMYKCNQKQDIKESVCHKGWIKYLTSCYKFVTSHPAQFDAAHQACQKENANLVMIESRREQKFINKVLTEKFPNVTRWRTAGRKV
ncbi:hypothetical protein EGW08_021488, partial [Elysia chlorotica]